MRKLVPQVWPSLFLLASFFAPLAICQADEGVTSEQVQQLLTQEYSKKILEDNSAITRDQRPLQMYEAEGQQLASQIELLTENEDVSYQIVPGDTLTISYRDREQVNRTAYKVSEQGEIYMPLLGPVKVAGLNRKQARERVNTMLKEYIREPRAVISLNTDGRLMIFGAVLKPGLYDVRNKLSVMESLLMAGGFNRRTAELASVIVVRGPVEKPEILKLNLKKMVKKGDRSDDIYVKPGDFIYVPTSFISNVEVFWNTAYSYLLQWYGLGGLPPIDGNKLRWGN